MFDDLAIVDVETTGGSPVYGRIIEIGIIRVKNNTIVDSFETLVNPQMHVPPEISMLTGIDLNVLENAPTFYSIKDQIYELLDGAIFVAHNARFDYSFIREEFKRVELRFSARQLCTAKLSRKLFPSFKHHNLDSIIERFGIECDARHRAMGDAKVLWNFLQITSQSIEPKTLQEAIRFVSKDITLPPAISRDVIDSLPESPGVYTFYGTGGIELYIGKSINLKERIQSHFQHAAHDPKESRIFSTIASLEVVQTEGELGALLEESRRIKMHKPLYNRLLRETHGVVVCTQGQTEHGYFTATLADVHTINPTHIGDILAVFKTIKQAKKYLHELAKEHILCSKLLGVENTSDTCFGYQLKTCNGACAQKELPAKYNLRFLAAFQKTKIKQWPFSGPIAIREGNTAHVVSHWCYLGELSDDSDISQLNSNENLVFDYDTYKILQRFLLHPTSHIHIQRISSVSG